MEEFVTDDYRLEIGENEGQTIYQVVNIHTGVMEYQDFLLSRIIETLPKMQHRLDEVREEFRNPPQSAPSLTAIPGGLDDGGGLH